MSSLRTLSITCVVLLFVGVSLLVAKTKAPAKNDAPKTDANGTPIPPADAQYTIYCRALGGPGHIEQANASKEALIKLSGMKDWYIIHQADQSVIYYGFYRAIEPPKDKKDPNRGEADRAQRDRKQIENLTDNGGKAGGAKLFDHCLFVPITMPDPTAPGEWNLLNSGGYWSLQIAAYKDSPHRKQAAVDAVRDARARGVNAYYYHGETTSSVCIGAWPKEAVRSSTDFDGGDGGVVAAAGGDADQDLLILPQPLPKDQQVEFRNRQGERVRDATPSYEAVDPSLMATMAQYPTHSINGIVYVSKTKDKVTGETKTVEDPSFLVQIPKQQPSLLRAQQEPPALLAPPNPAGAGGLQPQGTPGAARLKSIGD